VRLSTISLFRNLPEQAWMQTPIARGNPFTVRALALRSDGHVAHHFTILREKHLYRI
jgi:hypothetical protein